MKKKVLAFLLASTMIIEPFSVASAADFSDGTGQDTVQFSDDAEDIPEVENDDVDQFSTDAVGEGESSSKPSEDAIQMGNDVWVTFDDSTGTATISGTGICGIIMRMDMIILINIRILLLEKVELRRLL